MKDQELRQTTPDADEAGGRENPSEALSAKLDPLRPFVERTANVTFEGQNVFMACLVSSFVKSFEFVELTSRSDDDSALFLTASLRSIAEEIILLNHLSGFHHDTREFVLIRLMELEVTQNARYQNRFFRTFRPFQPVMPERINDEELLKKELTDFWQQNGWPNFQPRTSTATPPTSEIAAKSKPRLLEVVYDFIYRLSSNSVHFRPGEMNHPAPSGETLVSALLHGSYVRIMESGFISGTQELLKLDQKGLPLWPTYRPG